MLVCPNSQRHQHLIRRTGAIQTPEHGSAVLIEYPTFGPRVLCIALVIRRLSGSCNTGPDADRKSLVHVAKLTRVAWIPVCQ